jgi:hypothetical protein
MAPADLKCIESLLAPKGKAMADLKWGNQGNEAGGPGGHAEFGGPVGKANGNLGVDFIKVSFVSKKDQILMLIKRFTDDHCQLSFSVKFGPLFWV